MDWNASGRIDSFYFEKISNDMKRSLGELDCKVVGGSLTYSLDSDLKVSGVLNVVEAPNSLLWDSFLIRVWFLAQLGNEKVKKCLGTFYYKPTLTFRGGTNYEGKLELRSMIARYMDDLTVKQKPFKEGQTIKSALEYVFKNTYGGRWELKGFTNKDVFDNDFVVKAGITRLSMIRQILEDKYNHGDVYVDCYGKVIVEKDNWAKKCKEQPKWAFYSNENSTIMEGVECGTTLYEIPNRFILGHSYTTEKKVQKKNKKGEIVEETKTTNHFVSGAAELEPSDVRSRTSIHRWVSEYKEQSKLNKRKYTTRAEKKKRLRHLAKLHLEGASKFRYYYEFETFYKPINLNDVVHFDYGSSHKMKFNGIVSEIKIDLEVGARMKVKLRRIGGIKGDGSDE